MWTEPRYALPDPFFVLATQNPFDATGTSPLPHGQRDRFLVRLTLGYPSRPQMDAMLAGPDPCRHRPSITPSASADGAGRRLMEAVTTVHVAPAVRDLRRSTSSRPPGRIPRSPSAPRRGRPWP